MKKLIVILIALTLCLTAYTLRASQETIVICSTAEQFRNDYVQEAMRNKFPQYNVVITYMSAGKVAAKVAVEKDKTDIDILMAVESGYLSKVRDELADISDYSRLDYVPGLEPSSNGDKWITWERYAGAIIVNRQMLEEKGLPITSNIRRFT